MNKNDTIINETIDRFRKTKWHPWVRVTKIEVNGIYGTALWSGFEYLGLPFQILQAEEIKRKIIDGTAMWVTSCPQCKVDRQVGGFPVPTVVNCQEDAKMFETLLNGLFGLKSCCCISSENPRECYSRIVLPHVDALVWAVEMGAKYANSQLVSTNYGVFPRKLESVVARRAAEYCREAEEILQLSLKQGLRWGVPAEAEYVNEAIDRIIAAAV